MTPRFSLLMLLLPSLLLAADDCTFDQDHQQEVLAAVARRNPGAATDTENRRVIWSGGAQGTTTFAYGGCADLGSIVSRSTRLAAPRTQEQLFAVARELASRNWSNELVAANAATDALVAALEGGTFRVERAEGRARFDIDDPGYVQLYVEHDYENGMDTVTIGWQGNF